MKKYNKVALGVLAFFCAFGLVGPVVASAAGPAAINLGTAGNFVILTKTGISSTGTTSIVGDIGVSPAAATYITGFSLTLPVGNSFSTSAIVTGKVYAPGYADPTPVNLTTAVSDMQTAYTDGAGRTNTTATELGAGNIGGLTIAPGLYKWGTGVTIPTDVTLSGTANDVWIFVIAQTLNVSSAKHIVLSGGAQASNVFWIVAGQTTIGTTAVFNGNILDQTAIVLNTGAVLNGRALAQTAVTLDSNAVTIPAGASATVVSAPAVVVPVTVPAQTTQTASVPPVSVSNSGSSQTQPQTQIQTQTQVQTPVTSSNLSAADRAMLQAQLDTLIKSAAILQAQENVKNSSSISSLATNLGQGSRGADVTVLQQFLMSQNKGPAAQALAAIGATGYFGPYTRAALAEFQAAVGISPALGNFGPITRTYIGAHSQF
jgi:hypothetical protein